MCENKLGELAKSLIAAKAEMAPLIAAQTANVKMKTGGTYSYSFAELADVYRVSEAALGKHGIAIFQNVWTSTETSTATVETMLYHAASDQSFTGGHIEMRAAGTPQDMGSAITYARRYSLVSTVGLATQDDDGSAATTAAQSRQATNGKAPQATKPPAPKPKPVAAIAEPEPPIAALHPVVAEWLNADNAADAAKAWAVENGAQPNDFAARNSLKKIVENDFDGKFTKDNAAAVLVAFHGRQLEHLESQADVVPVDDDDYDHAAADEEHAHRYS